MAEILQVEQPKIETEIKIGNTYYHVMDTTPPKVSPSLKKSYGYLTKRQKREKPRKFEDFFDICYNMSVTG